MFKLVVALTAEALGKAITETMDYCIAVERLRQHKLLFSDVIKKEYERYFREIDNLMFYQKWFMRWVSIDCLEYCEPLAEDFNKELVSQMESFPFHIVIFDRQFESDKDYIKKIALKDINDRSKTNEFNMYCLPVVKIIKKDSSIDEIKEWFSNLLLGEESITIIDKYILRNHENFNLLKQYYLPMMSSAKRITIYYDGMANNQSSIITPLKKQYKDRIKLKNSDPRTFHDRYIVSPTLTIQIGTGLDFVDLNTRKTRLETTVSVALDNKPHPPSSINR